MAGKQNLLIRAAFSTILLMPAPLFAETPRDTPADPATPAPSAETSGVDSSAVAASAAATTLAEAPAAAPAEWTPLSFKNFGEELTSKWIPVPNGSSGAPRQGWLATADGFFTREFHLAYDFVNANRGPDAHEVLVRFNYPLTRRFWTGIEVPFYQRLSNGRDNFGDITLSTLFMLAETRNLSLNAGVGWRLPTGSVRLGNNQFVPTPQVNLWTDIGRGFSLRGRVGYQIADRGTDAVVVNATIGQTVTPHAKAPLGDLTWYVAGNWSQPVNRSAPTFVSITPGLRTHLGGNLFLLGGIEFPVTPQRDSFRQRFIVQIVQGF